MKFYEFIEELQRLNPKKVIMVKTGTFFNSIGKDAIILDKTLGLKRTCFARGLCKVGLPVRYVKENIEVVKKRITEKNIAVICYDEIENGRYKFKEKSYDILFETDGECENEIRKNTGCIVCENNMYGKNTNKYTIEHENFDKIIEGIEKILNYIKNK